nr:uncharacterized protein LOC113740878 [Coffea arabica]
MRIGKVYNICNDCGEDIETLEHMLFYCLEAQKVWKLAPIKWEGFENLQHNIWKWWQAVMTGTKEQATDHINLTVIILWKLWKARNKRIFEEETRDALKTVQKTQREWMEFDKANAEEGETCSSTHTVQQHQRKWERLKEGVIRINTDIAISAHMIRIGKGIIARNWTRKILRAMGLVEHKRGEASTEEALAVRAVLMMTKNAGWTKIDVQTNCKVVVDQIDASKTHEGHLATILEDIVELRTDFELCSSSFVHRTGNQCCHMLA